MVVFKGWLHWVYHVLICTFLFLFYGLIIRSFDNLTFFLFPCMARYISGAFLSCSAGTRGGFLPSFDGMGAFPEQYTENYILTPLFLLTSCFTCEDCFNISNFSLNQSAIIFPSTTSPTCFFSSEI